MNNLPNELILNIYFLLGPDLNNSLQMILLQKNYNKLINSLIEYIKNKSVKRYKDSILLEISPSHKYSYDLNFIKKDSDENKIIKKNLIDNKLNFKKWLESNNI